MTETLLSASARFSVGSISFAAETLGELDKVRVAEVNMRVVSELQVQLPLDHAIGPVHPDQDYERYLLPNCGLKLHRVHQETSVPSNRENLKIWKREFCCNCPWQCEGHCREAVGDDTCVRLIGRVQTGHPHLHRTRIDQHNVLLIHRRPDVGDDALGFDRVGVVVSSHLKLLL